MHLILIRHGEAEDFNVDGDYHRELTKKGKEQVKESAKIIKKIIKTEGYHLLSSGAVRTTESAEIILDILKYEGSYQNEVLFYAAELDDYLEEISKHKKIGLSPLILVGHNPSISQCCSFLMGKALKPNPQFTGLNTAEFMEFNI